MVTLRSELEKEEAQLRKELTKMQLTYNEEKRLAIEEEKEKAKFSRPLEEKIADYREMLHHSQDMFLNETTPQYNANGRIRRDEFRGLPKSAWKECEQFVKTQSEYGAAVQEALKKEDLELDAQAEECRRLLVAVEREKQ